MSTQTTETDMERRGLRVALYASLAISAFFFSVANMTHSDPVGKGMMQMVTYLGIIIALAGLAASAKKEPLR